MNPAITVSHGRAATTAPPLDSEAPPTMSIAIRSHTLGVFVANMTEPHYRESWFNASAKVKVICCKKRYIRNLLFIIYLWQDYDISTRSTAPGR